MKQSSETMQYFSDTKYLTIQKLLPLKAHCLFAIKVYASRKKPDVQTKSEHLQYYDQFWYHSKPELTWERQMDYQTSATCPSFPHFYMILCSRSMHICHKKWLQKQAYIVSHVHTEIFFSKWNKIIFPWCWQMHQQHSHFEAQKRQHTVSWWQSQEHFKI